MLEPSKAIEGWFLTFDKKEHEIIRQAFEELGYEFTSQGMKEYIIETIESIDEHKPGAVDNLVGQIASVVQKNPDQVKAYASLAGSAILGFLKKKMAAPR